MSLNTIAANSENDPAPIPSSQAAEPSPEPVRGGSTAVAERPAPPRLDRLPLFKVLLHNDDHNDALFVIETLVDLVALRLEHATEVMLEAHKSGLALVMTCHKERAELVQEQLVSKGLTATIEADR